jgi:quinol monooxygenase YgiN
MSVPLLVEFSVHPDRQPEFLDLLRDLLPETRAFHGCERIDIYVDGGSPGRVLLFEKWTDRGRQQAYLSWRTESGLGEQLKPFITAPPRFRFLEWRDI